MAAKHDSCMAMCFLTCSMWKKMWHKSFTSGYCLLPCKCELVQLWNVGVWTKNFKIFHYKLLFLFPNFERPGIKLASLQIATNLTCMPNIQMKNCDPMILQLSPQQFQCSTTVPQSPGILHPKFMNHKFMVKTQGVDWLCFICWVTMSLWCAKFGVSRQKNSEKECMLQRADYSGSTLLKCGLAVA